MSQHESTTQLMVSAIEKIAQSNRPQQVPISTLSGFGAAPTSSSGGQTAPGGLRLIQDSNPEMARALGVTPPLNWAFEGDMTNVEYSKIRKTMKSGKHRSNEGLVLQLQFWPHDLVSAASEHLWAKGTKPAYDNLTFAQYQEGMVQKILMEAPSSLDTATANKLKFQNLLIKLAYSLTWEQVRSIGDRFFEAWENKAVSWDNWSEIKTFVTEAAEQTRLSSLLNPSALPGAMSGAPHQSAPRQGNPSGLPKRKWVTEANGVPWAYMKGKGICCQFNLNECPSKGDHKVGEKGDKLIHHWCGGCFAKSGVKEAHAALGCKKGPFNNKSLFA